MPMVFLDNFCLTLTDRLTSSQTSLPVSASAKQELCARLGSNFSYLTLATPLGVEIVRVSCVNGDIAVVRAQGGTSSVAAAKGTCLCFKVNQLVLDNYLPQEYCVPTIITDTPDYITITAPADGSCEWKVNISDAFIDRMNICCPEDECSNCTVSDGVYENAKVTVVNGKICAISNGTNIVYSGGGCCGCAS
jgi:hypothetical protein